MIILSVCIVGVVLVGAIYHCQIYSTFSKYGIKHINPLLLVGNMARQCLGLEHFANNNNKLYKKFPEERFVRRFDYTNIDYKILTPHHRNDVIVFCTFEIKIYFYMNQKDPFYTKGRDSTVFGFRKIFMYFLISNLPTLTKIFEWYLLSNNCKEFFKNTVLNVTRDHELKQFVRPDIIQLLMDAKNYNIFICFMTDYDMFSGTLLLHLEDFGTVYELAVNSDFQDRFGKELIGHDSIKSDKFDYDFLYDMTYLENATSRNCSLDSRMYYVLVYL